MEEKINAIYVMVMQSELKPEDGGSYEGPLAAQKEECLAFLKEKLAGLEEPYEIYTSRSKLLKDMELNRVKRVIVRSEDRLGSNVGEVEGMLYELESSSIELWTVKS